MDNLKHRKIQSNWNKKTLCLLCKLCPKLLVVQNLEKDLVLCRAQVVLSLSNRPISRAPQMGYMGAPLKQHSNLHFWIPQDVQKKDFDDPLSKGGSFPGKWIRPFLHSCKCMGLKKILSDITMKPLMVITYKEKVYYQFSIGFECKYATYTNLH